MRPWVTATCYRAFSYTGFRIGGACAALTLPTALSTRTLNPRFLG